MLNVLQLTITIYDVPLYVLPIITYGSLFVLVHIGCYGDVLRVKILYNKKDSALIQFAESFQAQTGLYNLYV